MLSSSSPAVAAEKVVRPKVREYFTDRRAEVDVFVARHFTWPGTLFLHRSALGWDILRA
ncbi:MAG: DUF6635 family protein, partial [Ruegeria sp.]